MIALIIPTLLIAPLAIMLFAPLIVRWLHRDFEPREDFADRETASISRTLPLGAKILPGGDTPKGAPGSVHSVPG